MTVTELCDRSHRSVRMSVCIGANQSIPRVMAASAAGPRREALDGALSAAGSPRHRQDAAGARTTAATVDMALLSTKLSQMNTVRHASEKRDCATCVTLCLGRRWGTPRVSFRPSVVRRASDSFGRRRGHQTHQIRELYTHWNLTPIRAVRMARLCTKWGSEAASAGS